MDIIETDPEKLREFQKVVAIIERFNRAKRDGGSMKTNALATRQETVEDLAVTTFTTDELVVVIQQEHELVEGAASAAISHAIRCGLALLEIQKREPAGQWAVWMKKNLQISPATVERYMKIAYHREHVLASRLPTINAAVTYLSGSPVRPSRRYWPDELKKEAKRLRTNGLSYRETSELLGVPWSTVRRWLDPASREKAVVDKRALRARQRAARTALRQKERAEHIKRVGGKIDKAYSHLRWCLQETEGALADATDPDRRAVLRVVIQYLGRAEEEMGKV